MLDSNYSELLRILGNSGGDTTIEYDSPYSIALAILEANGVDTSEKHYDSLYSILEEIESMGQTEEKFTFSITTDSANTVVINGEEQTSVEVLGGDEITWSVSRTGYVTQTGSWIMRREDKSVNVTLVANQYTFTINTSSDNTVVINGSERTSITADYGTTINWSVSREHYVTQSGTTTLTADTTENITLVLQQFTYTIITDPANRTIINGEVRTTFTGDYGTLISWGVDRTGYVYQSGNFILTEDTTRTVTLVLETHTFTIVPTPNDATVTINGQTTSSVTVDYGTAISWSVAKLGYTSQSGSVASLEADQSINVDLVAEGYWNFINTSLDNTVVVDGETLSESTVFPGRYAFVGATDSTHSWEVSRTGYVTQSGTMTVAVGGTTVNVTLVPETYTFTIVPTPADATVTINGQTTSSVTVNYGTAISWSVAKTGYTTQSGSVASLTANTTETVTLVPANYTLTFDVTPNDATIAVNGSTLSGTTYTGAYGSTISYEISKTDYETVTGTKTITQDETITVVLEEASNDLTFEVVTPGNILWKNSANNYSKRIEYNKNGGGWTSIWSERNGNAIPVVAGDKVKFRGNNTAYGTAISGYGMVYSSFSQSDGATFYVYGDVTSLLNENNRATLSNYAFTYLFSNCSGLLSHPTKDILLPSTTLGGSSYFSMFTGCPGLTKLPIFGSFDTIPDYSMYSMFASCRGLESISIMNIRNFGQLSAFGMFQGCTNLTSAKINASGSMGPGAFTQLFSGNTSLNYIKCLDLTSDGTTGHRYLWTQNVASTGTFVKHPDATVGPYDSDYTWRQAAGGNMTGIPVNWTVINASNIKFDVDVLDAVITVNGNVISGDRYFGELGETVNYTISKTGYQTVSGTTTMPAAEGTTVTVNGHMRETGVNNDYLNMDVVTSGNVIFESTMSEWSDIDPTDEANRRTLEYSTDEGVTWNSASILPGESVSIPVTAGDHLLWRGSNNAMHVGLSYDDKVGFNTSNGATIRAYGDLSALTNNTIANNKWATLFQYCDGLLSPVDKHIIIRGANSGDNSSYAALFRGCSFTTSPAKFEEEELGYYWYMLMFASCSSLTTAPVLPSTTLGMGCYSTMFGYCTSLTTAPTLPATTLAGSCYESMFYECSSLTTAPVLPSTTLAGNCYSYMFGYCTSLTTAPTLPATTLTQYCYNRMFSGCTSLASAPTLPATTLETGCYNGMFEYCTSLASAPTLPATTLSTECYNSMFYGCTSLTTAPALPATTLASSCYNQMFSGCTSLTTAPELAATTLAYSCYNQMFSGCTSLTTAPELAATTLVEYCYLGMFAGCSSLNEVTCLATDISATDCVDDWLLDTAVSGTLYKDPNMTDWVEGTNVPSGWTIDDYSAPLQPMSFTLVDDANLGIYPESIAFDVNPSIGESYSCPDIPTQTTYTDGGNTYTAYAVDLDGGEGKTGYVDFVESTNDVTYWLYVTNFSDNDVIFTSDATTTDPFDPGE